MEFVMPKTRLPTAGPGTGPRRIGPEDEDRQSQLEDAKRDKRGRGDDVLKDAERRVREGAVDDTDFGGTPGR